MDEKTNVMRLLEQKRIPYMGRSYTDMGAVSGMEAVRALGEDPAQVFKTLAAVGRSRQYYVSVIPVAARLGLEKTAKAAGEESVGMIKVKELLPLTGYVHGGCPPIGTKKSFEIAVDSSAAGFETIISNTGRIGYQVEVSPEDLKKVVRCELLEPTVDTDTREDDGR